MGSSFSSTDSQQERKPLGYVDTEILKNCVVLFSTTTCKYCDKAKESFSQMGVNYKLVELDQLGSNGFKITTELTHKTGLRTVPQIFVNGSFLGGYTEMQQLRDTGKLIEMVYKCASAKTS